MLAASENTVGNQKVDAAAQRTTPTRAARPSIDARFAASTTMASVVGRVTPTAKTTAATDRWGGRDEEDFSMDELRKQREALLDKKSRLRAQLEDIDRRIQLVCIHDWRWCQVAGEGRICVKCDLRDFHDD